MNLTPATSLTFAPFGSLPSFIHNQTVFLVRQGKAGKVWRGMIRCGKVGSVEVWQVRYGELGYGKVWSGELRYGR